MVKSRLSGSGGSSESSEGSGLMALVKWMTGKFSGTFTHNVDTRWVLQFNPDDYLGESHVVEWRVPPKPRSGWPVWDGEILEVSGEYSQKY